MKKYFLAAILIYTVSGLRSQVNWAPYEHNLLHSVAYMQAVDKKTVWGVGSQDAWSSYRAFIRTTDGGYTWTSGSIDVPDMYSIPGMISAVDSLHAWIVMYPKNNVTSSYQGIYATADGGATWSRQSSADFPGENSFPDCIHFFNASEGWCLGDPGYSGFFVIYTTGNGGATWQQVSSSNIASHLPQETGITGYCCSVGDTSWFGTSKGRIYRSVDKGHTWTVSAISGWNILPAKPTFRDHLYGLAQNMSNLYFGDLVATNNGGTTWYPITYSFPSFTGSLVFNSLSYVPGTENTWVGTGYNGLLAKSNDGGLSWENMPVPPEMPPDYFSAWVDPETGWLSSFTYVYKFTGNIGSPVAGFYTADTSIIAGGSVHFGNSSQNATSYEWTLPGGTPSTSTAFYPVVVYSVPGNYDVTLRATNDNTSTTMTRVNYIRVSTNGIPESSKATISVTPNPAKDHFTISSSEVIHEIILSDLTGREIFRQKTFRKEISVNNLSCPPGLCILKMILNDGTCTLKILFL